MRKLPILTPSALFRLVLAAIAALASAANAARAQPPGGGGPPWVVGIDPPAAMQSSQTVNVTIRWCDKNYPLSSSRTITFKGQNVTSQFSYTYHGFGINSCAYHYGGTSVYGATSTGTVTLTGPGTIDTLRAQIYNVNGALLSGWRTWTMQVPTYTVEVTPDAGAATPAPYSIGVQQQFTVRNVGNTATSYGLEVVCAPPAAYDCAGPVTTPLLQPQQSWQANVGYRAGASGSTGTIRLRATYNPNPATTDGGAAAISVGPGGPSVAIVDVAGANVATSAERDQCLTISVGDDIAFECGDVRVVHELTGARTLNKARAPTLLYSSRLAQITPIVRANVTLAAGASLPDSVTARLLVRDPNNGTWINPGAGPIFGRWRGGDFQAGGPMRIAFSYSSLGEGSDVGGGQRVKLVDYRVEATAWNGNTPQALGAGEMSMILVDRSESAFGAGWWLAGLERLVAVSSNRFVWIGGDGSTRLYEPVAGQTNRWAVAGAIDRPDTLARDGFGEYDRRLPHGLRVHFDASGRHTATITRLSHTTTFSYNDAQGGLDPLGRLTQIVLPIDTLKMCDLGQCFPTPIGPPFATAPVYTIAYLTDLVRITAPPSPKPARLGGGADPREITLYLSSITQPAGAKVTHSVRDADGTLVSYAYDGSVGHPRRLSARTGPPVLGGGGVPVRGTRTRIVYGSADLVSAVWTDSLSGAGAYAPWFQSAGFPQVGEGAGLASAGAEATAVAVSEVYTLLDGPRAVTDHTRFWIDRLGAPWKVRNAANQETVITRGDSRFPALATEVKAPSTRPSGIVTWATYDARGNPSATTIVQPYFMIAGDDSRDATTFYSWNQAFDFVERITRPEGEVTRFGYDPQTGNRLWQEDGRGATSRVTFEYFPTSAPYNGTYRSGLRLLQAVVYPGGVRESYNYDDYGNLSLAVAPRGASTRFINDAVGRTTLVKRQIDWAATIWEQDSTEYDLADRATRAVTHGDATPGANGREAQRIVIDRFYNAGGVLDSLIRQSIPDSNHVGRIKTAWRYDHLLRTMAEVAPDGAVDSTWYDLAGNVDSLMTRRRHGIKMLYDEMNRLVKRRLPPVEYSSWTGAIRSPNRSVSGLLVPEAFQPYPLYPLSEQATTIGRDSAMFAYDAMGNMTKADNSSAQIHRSYYPNGALRLDTLKVRTVMTEAQGGHFEQHRYGLEYFYDRNGRRTAIKHPSQLKTTPEATLEDRTRYAYDAVTGHLAK